MRSNGEAELRPKGTYDTAVVIIELPGEHHRPHVRVNVKIVDEYVFIGLEGHPRTSEQEQISPSQIQIR